MFIVQKQRKLEIIMNNRKFRDLLLVLFIIFILPNESFALTPIPDNALKETIKVEEGQFDTKEIGIIEKISLKNKFKKTPEKQIIDFFKNYDKYSSGNNTEKLRRMYDDNFVNNDGFNKDTIFKMMELSSDSYENVEYMTMLDKIKINGNYAAVDGHEIIKGDTVKAIKEFEDKGTINSEIYYTNYLRKDGNDWKIIATDVKSEVVSIKYGEAKNLKVEVSAPDYVAADTDYEVTVKAEALPESFLVGAIINEPIEFPVSQKNDVYRAIKSNELARVIKSNNKDENEYATVSVAVTRAMIEPPAVVINMTGMAFIMKRVNVLKVNNINLDEVSFDGKSQG